MQLIAMDKNGNIQDIRESDDMLRKDISFRCDFRDFFKRAIKHNHDVIFSNDNNIKCVQIFRDERYKKNLATKAIEWINSPEGKAKLKEAHDRAEKQCEALAKAREVDWSKIHEPMTI